MATMPSKLPCLMNCCAMEFHNSIRPTLHFLGDNFCTPPPQLAATIVRCTVSITPKARFAIPSQGHTWEGSQMSP